jgi:hypothetical protein
VPNHLPEESVTTKTFLSKKTGKRPVFGDSLLKIPADMAAVMRYELSFVIFDTSPNRRPIHGGTGRPYGKREHKTFVTPGKKLPHIQV